MIASQPASSECVLCGTKHSSEHFTSISLARSHCNLLREVLLLAIIYSHGKLRCREVKQLSQVHPEAGFESLGCLASELFVLPHTPPPLVPQLQPQPARLTLAVSGFKAGWVFFLLSLCMWLGSCCFPRKMPFPQRKIVPLSPECTGHHPAYPLNLGALLPVGLMTSGPPS